MALTYIAIRNAKLKDKQYKLSDGSLIVCVEKQSGIISRLVKISKNYE